MSGNPGAGTGKRTHSKTDGKTDRRTEEKMAAVGYARVSTMDQDLALQLDALTAVGCAKVFGDRASGARTDRPGLRAALDYAREGDVLVTWKLDRLGRSLPHLIETVAALRVRVGELKAIVAHMPPVTKP